MDRVESRLHHQAPAAREPYFNRATGRGRRRPLRLRSRRYLDGDELRRFRFA